MRTRLLPLSFLLLAGCGGGGGKHSGSSSTSSSVTFAANSIVYGVANGTNADFAVDQVAPTGSTVKTVVADVDGAVFAFALDPSQASRYALAADDGTGTYGIYLSKNLSLSNATTLVAPVYVAVGSVAVTPDGTRVVYTATTVDGVSHLYVVPTAGGTPTPYGSADAVALAPNGDTVAFTDLDSSGNESLYLGSLTAGAVSHAQLVASGTALPAFSRDGGRLAYWTLGSAGNSLTVTTLAGGSSVTVPGVSAFEPQGLAFGPDGATLAFVGQSGSSGVIATAPADGSAAPTTILTDASNLLGNYGFFWTDANGRALAGARGASAASRARRKAAR